LDLEETPEPSSLHLPEILEAQLFLWWKASAMPRRCARMDSSRQRTPVARSALVAAIQRGTTRARSDPDARRRPTGPGARGEDRTGTPGVAARIIVLEPDGAKDVTEWFDQGHSETYLIAQVEGEAVSQ